MNAGYSGTPLEKKLGLKEGQNYALYNPNETYLKWFHTLSLELHHDLNLKPQTCDFIHAFCTLLSDLEKVHKTFQPALKKEGSLWVSWPKGSSKLASEINRDQIRNYFLDKGLVDVKVAAIDNDWSGLKFVYRLKDRKS